MLRLALTNLVAEDGSALVVTVFNELVTSETCFVRRIKFLIQVAFLSDFSEILLTILTVIRSKASRH